MAASDLTRSDVVGSGQNTFEVTMMYYATLFVPDLDEAEAWFARVFGRSGVSLESLMQRDGPKAGYPSNSSSFILVSDALIDVVDPTRYVVNGKQIYETATVAYLRNTGWYVNGMPGLFAVLKRAGFKVLDPSGRPVEDDVLPVNRVCGSVIPHIPCRHGAACAVQRAQGLERAVLPDHS